MVATHQAGHAVAAYLSRVGRRLEVLSIVKRKDALGLLAHNDTEERWTRPVPSCSPSCAPPAPAVPPRSCGSASRPPGRASLVPFQAMEEGLNERNVVARVLSDLDGRARTDRLLTEAKAAVKEQLEPPPAPARPRRPPPARPPAGPASRGGRSGPGRVGSPRR